MTCCGFGHRVLLMDIEKPLREVLERLVKEQGVTVFYTSGMGEFDELFARTVRGMKRNDPRLRLVLVLPYLTRQAATEKAWYESYYDEILIPAELDGVHPKAAITRRNCWMVDRSDFILAALHRDYGGAFQAIRYATSIGKPVITCIHEKSRL